MSLIDYFSKFLPRHFGILRLKKKTFSFFLLTILAVLGCLTGIFAYFSYTLPQNGDSVCSLLAGADIAKGNLLLKDWSICHVSYYFTDLLPWGFFVWLFGYKIYLLYIIPSLFSAFLIVVLTGIATLRKKKHSWYFAWLEAVFFIVMILCLVLMPGNPLNRFVNSSMIHMGIVFYLLGALLCIKLYPNRRTLSLSLLFIFNFCGIFSDSFWLAYWLLPLLILTLFSDIFQKNKLSYRFLVFSLLGVFSGYLALKLCSTYFFTIYPPAYNILPFNKIGTRIQDIVYSLLLIFNADAFNDFLFANKQQAFNLFAFPVMLMILIFLLPVHRNFFSVFVGCAMLCITFIVGLSKEYTIGSLRYFYFFAPFFILLFIAGLVDLKKIRLRVAIRLFVIGFICMNTFFLGEKLSQKSWKNGNLYWEQIVKSLQKEHLSCGISQFWTATPITVFSKESVQIRAIRERFPFAFFRWWSNRKWEKEFFEFFLIEKKQKISPEQQLFWQNLSWKKLSIHNLDVYVFHRPMNAHEIMACFQKNRQYFDASRLFIRKPGYKQEKTIFLNSKSSVDPRFSSPHLSARIIRKNAPVIVLEPGAVQFGPYAKLQKGSYHITIQGENLKALTFSCYSFSEKKNILLKNLHCSENIVEYDIDIPSDLSNIEFVSKNRTTSKSEIFEIQVQDTSTKIIPDFLSGFSAPDSSGIWSMGKKSHLKLLLPEKREKNITVRFEVTPFQNLKQADIFLNKKQIDSWYFTKPGRQFFDLDLKVPISQNTVDLVFAYHSPEKPCNVDKKSRDTRLLGVYFRSMKIIPQKKRTHNQKED